MYNLALEVGLLVNKLAGLDASHEEQLDAFLSNCIELRDSWYMNYSTYRLLQLCSGVHFYWGAPYRVISDTRHG